MQFRHPFEWLSTSGQNRALPMNSSFFKEVVMSVVL
jgi:hypothetical protein